MMCSSWKISVFGILALMLAFGLATPDALAQTTTIAYSLADAPDTASLRATDEVTVIFNVQVEPHATEGDQKAGIVTIGIPSAWSRPVYADDETEANLGTNQLEPGEVLFDTPVTGDQAIAGSISGRNIRVDIGKARTDSTGFEIRYRALAPHLQDTYGFPLSSSAHTIQDTNIDNIEARGGAFYLDIDVGALRSGAGKVTLSRTSKALNPQPSPGDKVLAHEGTYLLVSEESLADLVVTYEATGTVPVNSTITLTFGAQWSFTRNDDSQSSVSVSGGEVGLGRAAQVLTATVKTRALQNGAKVAFTLKGYKAPKIDGATAAADTAGNTIEVHTAIDPDGGGTTAIGAAATVGNKQTDGTYAEGDPQFNFIVTKNHGSGKVAIKFLTDISNLDNSAAESATAVGRVIGGSDLNQHWVFDFSEMIGLTSGAKIEIEVPDKMPVPYEAIGSTVEDGAVTGATRDGRKLSKEIFAEDSPNDVIAAETDVRIPIPTYRLNKAPAPGPYTFTTKISSGPHGNPVEITSPTIQIVGGDGLGKMAITNGGAMFTQTSSEKEVGNLVLTYTAGERMAKDATITVTIPTGWSTPRTDNGDGVADRGEIIVSDNATPTVTATTFTATTKDILEKDGTVVFTYKNVKVAKYDGTETVTFTTATKSHPSGTVTAIKDAKGIPTSPSVGIGRAPDGSGTIALSATQADAGSTIGDLKITFTATDKMSIGSVVEITIPPAGDWSAPSLDVSQPGGVTLEDTLSGTLTATATTMTATTTRELLKNDSLVFIYKNLTAPSVAGEYTFTAKSSSAPVGTPKALGAGATIVVDDKAAGSIALASATGPLMHASPKMALGNLAFTFTAGAAMANGAQVEITIPTGWTPPFLDNDDGTDAAGEVDVAGSADLSVSGGGGQPWKLTATTTSALEVGNTLIFTYKKVTAPSTEATYAFTTKSSVASGGTLLEISTQPSVVVRNPVASIAIAAAPTSVFTDGMITLTVSLMDADGASAKALGATTVMLSSAHTVMAPPTSDTPAGNGNGTPAGNGNGTPAGNGNGTPAGNGNGAPAGNGNGTPAGNGNGAMGAPDMTGMFKDADGNAITSITIADNMSSGTATYSNATAGMYTVTAESGMMKPSSVDVTIKSTIRDLAVSSALVEQGATIKVSATGKAGGGTVTVLDAEGEKVGTTKALDPDGDVDVDGDQEYSRSITLPAVLAGGTYTVSVSIQGDTNNSLKVEVVNDQTPPTLTAAAATPVGAATAKNGNQVALSVTVAMNTSAVEIASVTAGVSTLDSMQTDAVALVDADGGDSAGTYNAIITISDDNAATDGKKTITFTATDVLEKSATATATITLNNDVTAPVLSDASAMPAMVGNGQEVTISVTVNDDRAVKSVTVDAIAIGGGASDALALMPAANGNGNGTPAANGNGNGNGTPAANGNGTPAANGNGTPAANGNGTPAANGNGTPADNGSMDAPVDPGNGTYEGTFTVTGATDGAHMITITATDASGNSDTMDVTVNVDATAPVLTDASAVPDMASNGMKIAISVTSEAGLTVSADASAIGGGTVPLMVPAPAETATPPAANGNGTPAANGNGTMAGNGNGTAAGNGNGTMETAPATVTYTGEATVTTADTGAMEITITATDPYGNVAIAKVPVNTDSTAPVLADASASPAMANNGTDVTISVTVSDDVEVKSVTADAKTLGGADAAAVMLAAGTDNTYSGTVTVTDAEDGAHAITITATDTTGNSATASVTVDTDSMAPVLTDASAVPTMANNGMDVTISVNGGEAGLTVTADASALGGAADVALAATADDDTMYSGTVTVDADDGDQTITITASDATGNSSTATASVSVDSAAPTLADASAVPAMANNGTDVTISVNGGEAGLTVTANASALGGAADMALAATADDDTMYSGTVTVTDADDGDQTITITASDATGNSGTATASVSVDSAAPTLADASASPAMANNGTEVTISVNGGEAGLTVTADASALGGAADMALAATADDDTMYSGTVTVTDADDGDQTITITASDATGNSGAATASVSVDSTAPTLSDASASPAMANNGADVTISVNGGEAGLTVTADASALGGAADMALAATAADDTMYSGMVTVTGAEDGAHAIAITATDATGNSAAASVNVDADSTAPALTMASASPAMANNGTDVTVSVNGGESGLSVSADLSGLGGAADATLTEGADNAYSAQVSVTDAEDGDQTITITASDATGNSSTATASVSVDSTAPTLTDASVDPAGVVTGATVTISVNGGESGLTVTADASAIGAGMVTLSEDAGTAMYSGSATVNAAAGDQAITITATDATGNVSDAASVTLGVHEVTSAGFTPDVAGTGDMVTVTAAGSAGQTATFSVHNAAGVNIVDGKALTESTAMAGSYSGSFEPVVDVHPEGDYAVTVTIGAASMTAVGTLTIDHMAEFTMTIPAGVHLIHVPLDVQEINGMDASIDTVADLYAALGDSVNFIISLGADGTWNSYLGASSDGTAADAAIGADTGLVAVMSSAATLKLAGKAHGVDGISGISLSAGQNLVGVPLDSAQLNMISDVLALGITSVVVSNAAGDGFHTISQAGDMGDGPVVGGRGYIAISGITVNLPVTGEAWEDADDMAEMTAAATNGMTASAPSIGVRTPVLHVQGKLIDNAGMVARDGLTVTVRNVTSGMTLGTETVTDEYSMTFVKLDTLAAKVGDVIEIKADSGDARLGVRPVQYVVTAEDVLRNSISLPDLVTYEIPALTELLANYPNPFNPETWIPFRLAKDANVTLSIYGTYGSLVRTIDIGFTPAAVYEGRSDAIYWDGRNDFGEQVASGIYFYHLTAGDFSATRKMVIVK